MAKKGELAPPFIQTATSNWDNASPRNLIHRNSCFLMKTSDLRKLLCKLREIY